MARTYNVKGGEGGPCGNLCQCLRESGWCSWPGTEKERIVITITVQNNEFPSGKQKILSIPSRLFLCPFHLSSHSLLLIISFLLFFLYSFSFSFILDFFVFLSSPRLCFILSSNFVFFFFFLSTNCSTGNQKFSERKKIFREGRVNLAYNFAMQK